MSQTKTDKTGKRPFEDAVGRLREAGLRPTRQRLALARLLYEQGDRHVSAEELHVEARSADIKVSLATIYNTLNQFTKAGLLREVTVEAGRAWFDTNVSDHHHFYAPETGELHDIALADITVKGLPTAPPGREVERVDVVVRLKPAS
jgi:Fur family iron response transcriptional regulator